MFNLENFNLVKFSPSFLVIIFVVISGITLLFLTFYKNTRVKKVVWPIMQIISSIIFMGVMLLAKVSIQYVIFFIPILTVGIIFNYKTTGFCQNCGRMTSKKELSKSTNFCLRCENAKSRSTYSSPQ